jgi:hypothetical protein
MIHNQSNTTEVSTRDTLVSIQHPGKHLYRNGIAERLGFGNEKERNSTRTSSVYFLGQHSTTRRQGHAMSQSLAIDKLALLKPISQTFAY